jgi:hypothetical protein
MQNYEEETEEESTPSFRCRHIFTDGRRCKSASLRSEAFCFYHHTNRRRAPVPETIQSTIDLIHSSDLTERSSIQLAIGRVLEGVCNYTIDVKRAGLLLYGLQTAASALPRESAARGKARFEPVNSIEEITVDPELGPIAPITELEEEDGPANVLDVLMRSGRSRRTKARDNLRPTSIPNIQACAEHVAAASKIPRSFATLRMRAKLGATGRGCSGRRGQSAGRRRCIGRVGR